MPRLERMEYRETIQAAPVGWGMRGTTQQELGPQWKQFSIRRWNPRGTAASCKLIANGLEKYSGFPAPELPAWASRSDSRPGSKDPNRV